MSSPAGGGAAGPVTVHSEPGTPLEPVHVRLAWAQRDADIADGITAKMAAKRDKYLRRAGEMTAAVEESYAAAVLEADAAHARVAALAAEAGITNDHHGSEDGI